MKAQTIISGGKELRCGYTTGTCACAAAAAAAKMALKNQPCDSIEVILPDGERVAFAVESPEISDKAASCGVRKDAGDDIDVTDKLLICARVTLTPDDAIAVTGGEGIGLVTRPGLDQPVGEYAINRVPRMMIAKNVENVLRQSKSELGARVEIFIPGGEQLAAKTYNGRLGIKGGLSILGTTGIVEPMSEAALVKTIHAELRVIKAAGDGPILITPGNYGETFCRDALGFKTKRSVLCSNFFGETLDYACSLGFSGFLIVGHIGKLVKLAGGIFQTHSHVADARMEIIAAHAALAGAGRQVIRSLMDCATTDAAIDVLESAGLLRAVIDSVMEKIGMHIGYRIGSVPFGVIMFTNGRGLLGTYGEAQSLEKAFRAHAQ